MQRKTVLMVLWVATVIWIAAAVVGVVPALMSPMILAAPGALEHPAAVTLALSVGTFPVVCIVAVLLGWLTFALPALAHRPHRDLWACVLINLPLLNIATGGLALAWMSWFNGGSFN
ncbi:hypothetical protein C8255_02360 [filamentous cyanobacterium CCP3]|nr:hypothetical protein C8255_02360 [filamentous cyanobacterium CCP3]